MVMEGRDENGEEGDEASEIKPVAQFVEKGKWCCGIRELSSNSEASDLVRNSLLRSYKRFEA